MAAVMIARAKKVLGAVVAVTALAVLSACAAPAGGGDAATIRYTIDGQQRHVDFAVENVQCAPRAVAALSFPDKPYTSVSLTRGSTDRVSAWVSDESALVYFESDGVAVSTNTPDGGGVEYVVSGAAGRVAVTSLDGSSADAVPDVAAAIENAQWVDGTFDLRVRCEAES